MMRIVFMGTSSFAVPSLDLLLANGYDIVAVVTTPDKPQGRGQKVQASPIQQAAAAHGLYILQPTNLKEAGFVHTLRACAPDLQVVVAFRVLPSVVWRLPAAGTFNLHASLLPQYRGAAPIHWALIHGEKETGVTTFFIQEAIDTGDILFQEKVSIADQDTAGSLHEKLKQAGAQLVLKTVQAIEAGNCKAVPQPYIAPALLRQAPKLRSADGQVQWQQPAATVINFIRGLSPRPGAWTRIQNQFIKILAASPTPQIALRPGALQSDGKHYLHIGTQDTAISVTELQVAGRIPMPIRAFLQGHRLCVGQVDG
ncbi:MAG: methionyl-tRNA formyltransferase [Bacteroidota bacterium]